MRSKKAVRSDKAKPRLRLRPDAHSPARLWNPSADKIFAPARDQAFESVLADERIGLTPVFRKSTRTTRHCDRGPDRLAAPGRSLKSRQSHSRYTEGSWPTFAVDRHRPTHYFASTNKNSEGERCFAEIGS
jgi:hypothetical protein